jgi:choline dehydrogenase-like flavoprotein
MTGLPWQVELRTSAGEQDDGWLTMIMSTRRDADGGQGFTIPSSLMYASSVGELRLRSADPGVPPLLDFNYLAEPSDLVRLRHLARLALEIGHHPAFDAIRAGLRQPAPEDLESDASFDDWIARTIATGHHISCTCRMGPASDPAAVVDQYGRVYGLDNLWVIDASSMSDCPGANLNATVMMMAEKLADSYTRAPTADGQRSAWRTLRARIHSFSASERRQHLGNRPSGEVHMRTSNGPSLVSRTSHPADAIC